MTYQEIVAQIKANRHQHAEELREQAVMDHTQAALMAYALNDPQHMPSLQKAYPFIDKVETTDTREPSQPQPEWQNDQAMLIQQAMAVKATLERKKALRERH
jgi:hypothetical protein